MKWADLRRDLLKDSMPRLVATLLRALDVPDSALRVTFFSFSFLFTHSQLIYIKFVFFVVPIRLGLSRFLF